MQQQLAAQEEVQLDLLLPAEFLQPVAGLISESSWQGEYVNISAASLSGAMLLLTILRVRWTTAKRQQLLAS